MPATIQAEGSLAKPLARCADLVANSEMWQEVVKEGHGNDAEALDHVHYPWADDRDEEQAAPRVILGFGPEYTLAKAAYNCWADSGSILMWIEMSVQPGSGEYWPPGHWPEGHWPPGYWPGAADLATVEDELLCFANRVGRILEEMAAAAGTGEVEGTDETHMNAIEFQLFEGPEQLDATKENGARIFGVGILVRWR